MNDIQSDGNQKKINSDLVISVIGLVLAAGVYYFTRDLSRLGVIFVNYVLIGLAVFSMLTLITAFTKPEYITFFDSVIERNNIVIGVGILLCYLLMLPVIGFLPSSYIFYFAFNLYLSEERFTRKGIQTSLLLSVVVVTVFYCIFQLGLGVPLPTAMWVD